ncbi:oligopeptide transport system permease protein [Spiroplasma chinense]|uniref:Oligopeptide transport system permease protein n=1 Tax=Spiroplasma chinense TaxID=216932 RepID=A0A5B9Y413_9MOLU|nr:oligopeptide ABC transporter permease OppB [Spiroplasma chinense]QEH61503.1 oligopeptide transport system permease protein [Spiroplasma chinense]
MRKESDDKQLSLMSKEEREEAKEIISDIKVNSEFSKGKVNLNLMIHSLKKFNNKKNEFINSYPLMAYSVKRILYAFLTLYFAIAVVYILLNIVTNDAMYIQDIDLNKWKIRFGSEEYFNLINNRKRLLGVDGSVLKQILIYWRNVTPFIPKKIILDPFYQADGTITGTTVTKYFYLGVIFNSSSGYATGTLVEKVMSLSMPVSFKLGAISTAIAFLIGVPIGIYAALNKENAKDNSITGFCLLMFALPALVIVRLFYQFVIYYLGAGSLWAGSTLYTQMFPVILLILLTVPGIIFQTRRYIIIEMNADYTKFALSKGMTNRYVFFIHIFRVAGIAIIRSIPAALIANLFGSSLLVEQSWNVLGMANITISAISSNDIFLILGIVFISASVSLFLSLISDLLITILDPRVKLIEKKGS